MNEQQRQFLESHRLCVLGVERAGRPPHLSPVYYVLDGEDILISVTKTRAKTAIVRRTGRASLCVLHEQFPFPYLRVEGNARIEDENAPEVMMKMMQAMTGNPVTDAMRPAFEERARSEQRVVLRVTPEVIFQPSR